MATKPAAPSDEAQNWLLDQALEHMPGWLEARYPWESALRQKWSAYEAELSSEISLALRGAGEVKDAATRKKLKRHAEFLESLKDEPIEQPENWLTEQHGYKVGELLLRSTTSTGSRKETPDILGQVDLTISAFVPVLKNLNLPGRVHPPISETLGDTMAAVRRARKQSDPDWIDLGEDDPDNKWSVSGTGEAPQPSVEIEVRYFRFVLAPSPANRPKVLRQMQLIQGWVETAHGSLSGLVNLESEYPRKPYGSAYYCVVGVVSDDERLCDIAQGQGDEALYIPKS